ncbi:MAG TPA: CDP-alcohol phosphatidyltransferase family protein [Acidimicrobiales bacterium]
MIDAHWRTTLERGTKPVGEGLRRAGVRADHLTALGLGMAGATCVVIATGHLGWGLALLILSAVPDMLDGAVAKASGTSWARGSFFDSVADRLTDGLVLGGVAWYLAGRRGGGRAAILPMAVMGASLLISYERAKAESLGYTARGGLMERAERVVALCAGLAFSALLVPVLWLMLGLTAVTAVQRFVMVWRQAGAPPEPAPVVPRWRARADRSEPRWWTRPERDPARETPTARWRARRQAAAASGSRQRVRFRSTRP